MRYLRASSIVLFVLAAVSLGAVLNEVGVWGAQEPTQEPTQEATQQPRKPDGPVKYATRDEAAQAAGFTLPSTSATGWSFKGPAYVDKITAPGSNPRPFISVQMAFEKQDVGIIELYITSPEGPPEASMPETVTLADGRQVRLGRKENSVGVKWNEEGRSITATTTTSDAFTEADFLSALATLRY
jgi:hypothetical protein